MRKTSKKAEDVPRIEEEDKLIPYDIYSQKIQNSYKHRDKELCDEQRLNILTNLKNPSKNDEKTSYFSVANNVFLSLWSRECSIWQKIVSTIFYLIFLAGLVFLLFFFLWVLKEFKIL